MAAKPSIHKFTIALSDLDRDIYDALNLTVARHPSETIERMMVRVLAFCYNANENLIFCKGLSDSDEADLWEKNLGGTLDLWIDVGEPAFDRIKKASRIAKAVRVYAFNTKASVWWSQQQSQFSRLNVSVYRFPWEPLEALANVVDRTMDLSVTISSGSAYVATANGEFELTADVLQSVD